MGCIWEHVFSSQVQPDLTEKYSTAREGGFSASIFLMTLQRGFLSS